MNAVVDVSVITSGHDVADARLHREVAAFLAAGLSVEVLGLGEAADGPPGAEVRTWPRRRLAGRAVLAGRIAAAARGRVLFTLDPDSALAAAALIRRRGAPAHALRRRRLVVDVHEDYARLLADRSWARQAAGVPGKVAAGLVSAFMAIAARADLTVVADGHVPPLTARHRIVVPNLPDLGMLPEPGPADPRPRALYVGDVRTSRGLFAMLEAIRHAPGWELDVVGPPAPADQVRLEEYLAADARSAGEGAGLAERVRLHGRMPPVEAYGFARGARVGLLLLDDTPAFVDALPSKIHEYLACGLAVIATDLPRQAELLRDTGAGVVVACGEPAAVGRAVAAHLRDWARDPATLDRLRDRAATYARRLRERPGGYGDLAQRVAELARG